MSMSGAEDIRSDDAPLEAVASVAVDPGHDECDQCGAPVDQLQRYCVGCGAHRHHVPDPAARYLAQASARSRGAASGAGRNPRPAARQARRRLSLGPLTAALAAAVLAGGGVAVGAAIDGGHGSNDAQLVRTLHRLGISAQPAGKGSGSHSQTSGSSPTTGGSGKATSPGGSSGKAGSSSSAAQRLQHATGKSYRKQAQQLPNSVAIP